MASTRPTFVHSETVRGLHARGRAHSARASESTGVVCKAGCRPWVSSQTDASTHIGMASTRPTFVHLENGAGAACPHAQTGPGVRSERNLCGRICSAAASRRAAAARSGIIGLTIRDASCCHWTAVGIRQGCGRLSAAKPLGSTLADDDLDGCCLSAKLWARGLPWATAKRDFAVRMGRPFVASGACVARIWRAVRA